MSAPSTFWKDLKKGEVRSLYVLYGPEVYLRQQALKALRSQCVGELSDFNLDEFEAGPAFESVLRRFSDALRRPVIGGKSNTGLGGKRLVVLKKVELLRASQVEFLTDCLKARVLPRSTVLVLDGLKWDARSRLARLTKKLGTVVPFEVEKEFQLPAWVQEQVHTLGWRMSKEAASFLLQVVPPDRFQLKMALERLVIFLSESTEKCIQVQDIQEVLVRIREESIFRMVDGIGQRQVQQALSSLESLVGQGEPPLRILALLVRHFRILLLACELQKEGNVPQKDWAGRLGVPPFFVRNYMTQGRNWSKMRLKNIYNQLLETDRLLKSTSHDTGVLFLKRLVLRIVC